MKIIQREFELLKENINQFTIESNAISKKTHEVKIDSSGLKISGHHFPENSGIYIIYTRDNTEYLNHWIGFKKKNTHIPRLNEKRKTTHKNKTWKCIYVGKTFFKIEKRLNQHLATKENSTYALYLGEFAKYINKDIEVKIETYSFNSSLEEQSKKVLIAALESMLHLSLEPLIGKA